MTSPTHGGPPGNTYQLSDSGWMELANFHEWFVKLFLPAVLRPGQLNYFLIHEAIEAIELVVYGHFVHVPPTHCNQCIWLIKANMVPGFKDIQAGNNGSKS